MPLNKLILPTTSLHIAAFVLLNHSAWSAENPVPSTLPKDRYSAMKDSSPFALASPAAPVEAPQASFAANWFISGIGRLNDEDYVTIKARDLSAQFSLFGHEPNAQNGVSLASVNWSDTIGKSTVILQKGTETAKFEFNEAEMRGPAQGAPAGAGTVGQKPGGPGSAPLPVMAPLPSTPTPGRMPLAQPNGIPRPVNPGAGNPGGIRPNTQQQPGRPPEIRRRPIPIQPPR